MNDAGHGANGPKPSKGLHVGLWVVQGLLAVTFVGAGLWKLLTPVSKLAEAIPWAGQVSSSFLQAIALIDLLGGIGLALPAITRIKPGLTVLAALGCAALQVCAIVFHVSRGEAAKTPFNFLLVALSLFVAWGRWRRAPIEPRA
jgi:DoxX-like family